MKISLFVSLLSLAAGQAAFAASSPVPNVKLAQDVPAPANCLKGLLQPLLDANQSPDFLVGPTVDRSWSEQGNDYQAAVISIFTKNPAKEYRIELLSEDSDGWQLVQYTDGQDSKTGATSSSVTASAPVYVSDGLHPHDPSRAKLIGQIDLTSCSSLLQNGH